MRSDNPSPSMAQRAMFVVTPQGHEAAATRSTCSCTPRFAGLLFECPKCGTIYGIWHQGPIKAGGDWR